MEIFRCLRFQLDCDFLSRMDVVSRVYFASEMFRKLRKPKLNHIPYDPESICLHILYFSPIVQSSTLLADIVAGGRTEHVHVTTARN